MALREDFEKQGNWLFRHRSHLPLLLVVVILLALVSSSKSDYESNTIWELCCLTVSFLGLTIRILTIGYTPEGTSGRNTEGQIADTLNTNGMYSVVRHPLYLGNCLIWLGVSLFLHIWWVSLVFLLVFWLYYERIMFAEEVFLRARFGESYLHWSDETPAFLPKFKCWRPSELRFSLRNVLKREYSGFYAIIVSFTFLGVLRNAFVSGEPSLDVVWVSIFAIGTVIYLVLRTMKKKTRLLHVQGR